MDELPADANAWLFGSMFLMAAADFSHRSFHTDRRKPRQRPPHPNKRMAQTTDKDADFKTAAQAYVSLVEQRAEAPCLYPARDRPRLTFHGEPVILLDDIITGLDISEKTIRRYRDAGKIKVYESIEGNIKFVLQCDLDEFLEKCFISSSHPHYRTVKCRTNSGGNAQTTTTKS